MHLFKGMLKCTFHNCGFGERVHQDMTENMFAETEMAQALREIRARDPSFDMPKFLTLLKNDVPIVIRAYLENDAAVLKEHCSPEMVERLTGIMTAQHAEVRFLAILLAPLVDIFPPILWILRHNPPPLPHYGADL
jgi:predicted lipid-binding transport protein (Tim44 family)